MEAQQQDCSDPEWRGHRTTVSTHALHHHQQQHDAGGNDDDTEKHDDGCAEVSIIDEQRQSQWQSSAI